MVIVLNLYLVDALTGVAAAASAACFCAKGKCAELSQHDLVRRDRIYKL